MTGTDAVFAINIRSRNRKSWVFFRSAVTTSIQLFLNEISYIHGHFLNLSVVKLFNVS